MTKITGLTRYNVLAIEEVFSEHIADGSIKITHTTAVFDCPAQEALDAVTGAMSKLPTRGHPRASLHAVARKLAAQR